MNQPVIIQPQQVQTWIFDLDNTLYPVTKQLLEHIDQHLGNFVAKYLGISREEAHKVQKTYFKKYGLTLRGLMLNDGLDPEKYFEEMTPMDLNEVHPNPALGAKISDLEGRKFIYTNASAQHAKLVLDRMEFDPNTFDAIFDIEAANYIPKPAIESYQLLCEKYTIDPTSAAMIDDIAQNLVPAAKMGMLTIWKNSGAEWAKNIEIENHINYVVENLEDWLQSIKKHHKI
tara:strand:- start:530 stop:1219 length:690 start_codon:yes stop_codon:yes gene_type:complete